MNKKRATIAGILACGFHEKNGESTRYRVFQCLTGRLLVGKAGAIRFTKSSIEASRSLTGGKLHATLEYVGRYAERCPGLTANQYKSLANAHKDGRLTGLDLMDPEHLRAHCVL